MAVQTEILQGGGPAIPARPRASPAGRVARRLRLDRWTSRLVVVGGLVIIASILAILLVILLEVWPLFRPPRAALVRAYPPGTAGMGTLAENPGLGVDEYRALAFAVERAGALRLVDLGTGTALPPVAVPATGGAEITTVTDAGRSRYGLATADGRVVPLEMAFEVSFAGGQRTVTPRPAFGEPIALDPEGQRPVQSVAMAYPDKSVLVAGQLGPREIAVHAIVERRALVGPARREVSRETLSVETDGTITRLAVDGRGEDLFVGTSRGEVIRFDLRDRGAPRRVERADVSGGRGHAVTALGFLIGDRTLVAGDAGGGVSTWQVLPPPAGGEPRLVRIHGFAGHSGPVLAITPSRREKSFATADRTGEIRLHYGTSGRTLLVIRGGEAPLRGVAFSPKADGLVTLDERGGLGHWQLDNPHPEVTLATLFGRVWYEGYPEPAHVWQSTGGTDDFESKLSLTPLLFGTMKGTVYALLVAVPLALLAALYVSEFMHPALKASLKPVVEIMAALPSVVLGFLAGLWLAPVVERIVPGVFLAPLVVPVFVLGALLAWQALPRAVRGRARGGTEVFLLVPVVALGLWAAIALGGAVESALLGGNYRAWLASTLGVTYDQRNSLVVGIAMGFAVIPIIFTIAEDSLANVPGHLRAGSLALGASRWQTALRIVLPTASPGIFSAVMIGFGRAVGETMIVLMATGNTPVMDWSIFNGFRALSANIAVELPEAPEGGTLFRVLFLAALLLFALTFVVNTAAEVVRLRLRRKYRYL